MRVIEGSPEHRWNTRFDARRGVLDPRPARKKNRSKTGSTSRCPTSRTEGFWFTRRFVDSEPTCDARGVWRYGPGITYFASRGVRERPRRTPTSADGSVCGRTPGLLRLEESQRSLFTSESDGNDVREMLRVASADVAGYAKRGGMRGGSPFLSNNAAYSSSKKTSNETVPVGRCVARSASTTGVLLDHFVSLSRVCATQTKILGLFPSHDSTLSPVKSIFASCHQRKSRDRRVAVNRKQ